MFLSAVLPIFLISNLNLAHALKVDNISALRKSVGLTQESSGRTGSDSRYSNTKVAILDNGFQGFTSESSDLPHCTEFVDGPGNAPAVSSHGLRLAEVFYQLLNQSPPSQCSPKIYLINSNGFTNLKSAIDFTIREKIDVVIYATNWEYGGNFDGQGFINQEVKRATDSGIIWINAAGDYRGLVYEDQIELNDGNNVLTLHPIKNRRESKQSKIEFENRLDQNSFKIVLSWNDFKNVENYATSDDLDIAVLDESGEKIVAEGVREQTGNIDDANTNEAFSGHAREIIQINALPRGKYFIQVSAKSKPTRSNSIRITLVPDKFGSLNWIDQRPSSEIMVPADMEEVITVGDTSPVSARGKTADGRMKPDILLPVSQIEFSDGSRPFGTSFAAAIFGAVIVDLKSRVTNFNLAWIQSTIGKLKLDSGRSTTGALELTSYEAVKAALGGTELQNIPEGASFAMGTNPMTLQPVYYVLVDNDPKLVSPFVAYPNSMWTSTSTHIYLMSRFRHLVDFKTNDSLYGPEFLRFVNRSETQVVNPETRGVPMWKMPQVNR